MQASKTVKVYDFFFQIEDDLVCIGGKWVGAGSTAERLVCVCRGGGGVNLGKQRGSNVRKNEWDSECVNEWRWEWVSVSV